MPRRSHATTSSAARLLLAQLGALLTLSAGRHFPTEDAHDQNSRQYKPAITSVSCDANRGTDSRENPFAMVVKVADAKPESKIVVGYAPEIGEAAWGYSHCANSLVSGLSEGFTEKWARSNPFGQTKVRITLKSCAHAAVLQVLSAPYRAEQCQVSDVVGNGPAQGVTGTMALPVTSGTAADVDELAVRQAIAETFLGDAEKVETVAVTLSDEPFPSRRLLTSHNIIHAKYNINTRKVNQLLETIRNYADGKLKLQTLVDALARRGFPVDMTEELIVDAGVVWKEPVEGVTVGIAPYTGDCSECTHSVGGRHLIYGEDAPALDGNSCELGQPTDVLYIDYNDYDGDGYGKGSYSGEDGSIFDGTRTEEPHPYPICTYRVGRRNQVCLTSTDPADICGDQRYQNIWFFWTESATFCSQC